MTQVSIVVPIYNEVESVGPLCERLNEALVGLGRTYEVVLVDDGSRDGTWEKLKELAGQYPYLRLIRFRRNFGQTAAMTAGFQHASGDVIVTLDADLQNDPADISMLLDKADEGFDVVSGWRRDRKDTFINRRLPSMLANGLISRITGVPLHDYGCTLKAYRKEVVSNIKLYGEMHRFIPAIASWVGAEVAEVVVTHHARQFGQSKYGISRTLRVVLDLMTVKFLLRYSSRPIQMFGKLGLWMGIPGLLILLVSIASHIGYNLFDIQCLAGLVDMSKRPAWIITPFMLILFCTQFISMGLLAEIQIRTYHEAQDKPTYVIKETVEPR
ncbi:MAG: glycosyltransferase family 2 protein [Verrucomicrobia bacterium]|nr:glycosyltransferase family 2 protein [Verrucomicrobiota bacterium]MDA1085544.1 glycosyltransferase family 2 protein [Verrucomicrobiota bacterium]